jgi:hypothetical protein
MVVLKTHPSSPLCVKLKSEIGMGHIIAISIFVFLSLKNQKNPRQSLRQSRKYRLAEKNSVSTKANTKIENSMKLSNCDLFELHLY